jgi:L-alanine-DL-glutamate epimerase-like enolase superfamily enzyme
MAAWQLYARLEGLSDFDEIYRGHGKAEKMANVPLITYGTPVCDVVKMAKDGVCLFKIKLGSNPDNDNNLDKMLAWDKTRALEIHNVLKNIKTPYTESGNIVYYFDANGRYDTKERLCDLISFMDKEGILERTVLFEEPFAPENEIYIGDLPVCFAADESAHSLNDVKRRIELGFKAITLKPIAKTPSVTIEMANCAYESGVQCFCADLTVNPLMVEWNKNFAARLKTIKGMKIAIVESNGAQNYKNWEAMKSYVPRKSTETDATVYTLDQAFYENAGGLFEIPEHYLELIKAQNPDF